ncbi:hypothetical protein BU23DRAFT_573431 [Bimuria novae-zelandiae CBS 107.79]|uniref:Uncharacterized protein n=1 Tax=Bimuria novae-zelandiae CBS 107.79 TaxID=1447943 RepID=A0A6A5V1H3_9PLEO|nr:hypothetical protein BU23DRAFT_573431 [Bimuria novae-zelandiae CBS 107.79]
MAKEPHNQENTEPAPSKSETGMPERTFTLLHNDGSPTLASQSDLEQNIQQTIELDDELTKTKLKRQKAQEKIADVTALVQQQSKEPLRTHNALIWMIGESVGRGSTSTKKKRAQKLEEIAKRHLVPPPIRLFKLPLKPPEPIIAFDTYGKFAISTSVQIAGQWHLATIDESRASVIDSRLTPAGADESQWAIPPSAAALFGPDEWNGRCAEVSITFLSIDDSKPEGEAKVEECPSRKAVKMLEIMPTLTHVASQDEKYTIILGNALFLKEQAELCKCIDHYYGNSEDAGTLRLLNGATVKVNVAIPDWLSFSDAPLSAFGNPVWWSFG